MFKCLQVDRITRQVPANVMQQNAHIAMIWCKQLDSICLTSMWFHVLFTLSSEYFSTFPHGTCWLSDSYRYLALDGVYHPFWTALSSNPTLWWMITHWTVMPEYQPERAYHHLWVYKYKPQSNMDFKLARQCVQTPKHHIASHTNAWWLRCWANLCSLAVTKRILFSLLSTAYWYA